MKKIICFTLMLCLVLSCTGCFFPVSKSGGNTDNTRTAPAQVNQKVVYDSMKYDYDAYKIELTLLEVRRGGAALKMLKEANNNNDLPEEGKEYLLAKFNINFLQSKSNEPIYVDIMFDIVKSNGSVYEDSSAFVQCMNPLTTMYTGATQEGYICFTVDKDDDVVIVFPRYNNSQVWFSGESTVGSEDNDYNPLGDPNKLGSKNNPAKLNETANFNGTDLTGSIWPFNINLTVTELNRGERALDTILSADKYNDIPKAGKEYLIAKVKAETISSRNGGAIDINYDFKLFNSGGIEYTDTPYISGLENKGFSKMYPNAVQESYLVFLVDESDLNPFIVAFSDSQTPVWFSVSQSNSELPFGSNIAGSRNESVEAWALGCSAILADNNGYNPHQFGMFERSESSASIARLILSGSWDINDRDDLIATIERMTDGGHNKSFAEAYELISPLSNKNYKALLNKASGEEKYMIPLTKSIGDKWGDKQIKAWDWFRMIHLAGWGYIAGYLELQETYDLMIPVIERLQGTFSSWDEAVNNYMDGYAWWSKTDVSKSGTEYKYRLEIYEELKTDKTLFDPTVWK